MDWNQPYSCQGWATSFGQTLPILDDNSGRTFIPYSVLVMSLTTLS